MFSKDELNAGNIMKDFQGKTFENNSKQSNEKSEIWALKCQNTSKENIKIVIKV